MEKQPAIYIITNKTHSTLYVGVTSNLIQRVYQHRESLIEGFSKRYNCHKLVYYECFETMETAIHREKRLKKYRRKEKDALINGFNANWQDLYLTLF